MTRRADSPNRLTQTIKNLTAGRLYSVKTDVAKWQDIVRGRTGKWRLGASVKIRGGELFAEHSFVANVLAIHRTDRWAEKNRTITSRSSARQVGWRRSN